MVQAEDCMDVWLPTEEVEKALRDALSEDDEPVEVDGTELVFVPGVSLEVVARSFHSYQFDIGFGDHFRALVAIGGLKDLGHGIVEPGICFATLYLSTSRKLITFDLSLRFP